MLVHEVLQESQLFEPHVRYLMSDLHLGSPAADEARIVADLDKAASVNARILINGDVFDSIGPKDKRYESNTLVPSIQGKKDLAKAVVSHAYELLAPFAANIDVMGIGNHEESWIKYGYFDPVAALIEKLNASHRKAKIVHGSFWGYINTKFYVGREKARHKLLYYHGSGGDSPVTKGLIDFNRKGRNWYYDLLTFGHKHNLTCSVENILDVNDRGRMIERHQLNLQTGSYYRNYKQIERDGDPLDYGYAASKAHSPKPLGGIFVTLRPVKVGGCLYIRQDFASDLFPVKFRKTA